MRRLGLSSLVLALTLVSSLASSQSLFLGRAEVQSTATANAGDRPTFTSCFGGKFGGGTIACSSQALSQKQGDQTVTANQQEAQVLGIGASQSRQSLFTAASSSQSGLDIPRATCLGSISGFGSFDCNARAVQSQGFASSFSSFFGR